MKSLMGDTGMQGRDKGRDLGMGLEKGKGKGWDMKGKGMKGNNGLGSGVRGTKGKGLGMGRAMDMGLGLQGVERTTCSREMGQTGVEGIKKLGLPTLRAISCNQLLLPLQQECFTIPVARTRETAWTVKITPVLHMPAPRKHRVKAPARIISEKPEL